MKQSRTRGKGKVPAMVHVNLRLTEEVVKFFSKYDQPTTKMREVLTNYAENNRK